MVTYYVVIAFQRDEDGFVIGEEPRQARDEGRAKCMALELAASRAGVIAFSRKGNPELGDWEDAQIIFRRGELPEGVFEPA